MNFLIVSAVAEGIGLAVRLQLEGHSVKMYINSEEERDVGDGLVEKVNDWEKEVDWADLVFFDDCDQSHKGEKPYTSGKWSEQLKKEGKLVIGGGHPDVAKLENDRMYGMEMLKKYKAPVPELYHFTSFDKAKAFLKKIGGDWALKHQNQVDRDASTVGSAIEVIEFMEYLNKNWAELGDGNPVNFVLQPKAEGIEIAATAFFDGERFRKEAIYLNQEIKKELNGDLGRSTGQMGEIGIMKNNPKLFRDALAKIEPFLREKGLCGFIDLNTIVSGNKLTPIEFTCYDEQTEILTKSGWKHFKDLQYTDEVATLNPDTDIIEYHKPVNIINKHYDGEMISFGNHGASHTSLDLLVTPDHSMYFKPIHKNNWEFRRADQVTAGSFKRTAKWEGVDKEYFSLPGYTEQHYLGRSRTIHPIEHPAIEIPMDDWLFFLGLYVSEGSMGCHEYVVNISQSPGKKKDVMRSWLNRFPFNVRENDHGFEIASAQLTRWIKNNCRGNCSDKFIPQEFKELPPKRLSVLFDGLMLGDGSVHKRTQQRSFYTTSRILADDVQEIILKTGNVATISVKQVAGTEMTVNGKTYKRRHNGYCVKERTVKVSPYVDKRIIGRKQYSGNVYCCTVPNHIIYVRRNGKPVWCGNCRPGYPTFFSFMNLLDEPIGEWLIRMAKKDNKPIKTSKAYNCTVVLTSATFPDQNPKRAKMCIIHGLDKVDLKNVWLCETRVDEGKIMGAGTMGYLAVVTTRGVNIPQSAVKAYNILGNIKVTPYKKIRTDIGEKAKKEFPKITSWLK